MIDNNPLTLTMSFNRLLANNPLPFSICLKNVEENVNVSEEPHFAVLSTLDEIIKIFLLTVGKMEIETDKTLEMIRNEADNVEPIARKWELAFMEIAKIFVVQLDEEEEKFKNTMLADENKESLTAEEEEYVMEYIRQVRNFCHQLYEWMAKMIEDILQKFQQGHSGEDKAASLLFQTIIHILQHSDIHGNISANCKVKRPCPSHGIFDSLFRLFISKANINILTIL